MSHGKEVTTTPSAIGNKNVVALWAEGNEDFSSEKGEEKGSSSLTSFRSILVPSVSEVFVISKPVSSSLSPLPSVSGVSMSVLETSNKQENTKESNHRNFLFYEKVFIRSNVQ